MGRSGPSSLVPEPLKVTLWFGFGRAGLKSNAASGAALAARHGHACRSSVDGSPSESVTRRPTVLAPGVEKEWLTWRPVASS